MPSAARGSFPARRHAAPLALAVLVGCTGGTCDAAPVAFVPDPSGLAVMPGALRIDFGRAPEGVIAAVTRVLGRPETLPLSGCPAAIATRLRWDDLDLTFTADRFVGWRTPAGQAGQVCGADR